jgi:predicted permease
MGTYLRVLAVRIIALFSQRRGHGELNDEIRTHLDLLAEEYVRRGMSPRDARAAARREFGGVDQVKETYRDQRGLPFLDMLSQDVRYGLRQLGRNRGFAAVAVTTLAFGIGATTAIFSVVDTILLRPLAFRDAGRLAVVHTVAGQFGRIPVNDAHFSEWRRSAQFLDASALLLFPGRVNLTGSGEPGRLSISRASSSLFTVLGVQPQLGRTFTEDEETVGRDRVVIISDAVWRSRFAADPTVIGRIVSLDGIQHEIVGVLPRDVHLPIVAQLYSIPLQSEPTDVWMPLALRENEPLRGFNFACIVRLKAGVSAAQATDELNALLARSSTSNRTDPFRVAITPLQTQVTSRSRVGLQLLLAAVGAVLLIACVNITNLLLARSSGRRREIAIRSAIGASRARLARQLFTESLVLVALGAAAGVALAYGVLKAVHRLAPPDMPRLEEVQVDMRVLLLGLAISTATALLVGLLPSLRFAAADFQQTMRGAAAMSSSGRRANRTKALLVSTEIALSVVCLIAGGLLLRSFVNLVTVDKGFESNRLLTFELNLPSTRYGAPAARGAFQRGILDRLGSIPGVVSTALSNKQLLSGEGINLRLRLDGWEVLVPQLPLANIRAVNPDYFRTFGIPLRSGRIFDQADRARPVAVLSAQTAERLWPGERAVGRTFRRGAAPNAPLLEVVGIAADVRGSTLDKTPMFTVYEPYWQFGLGQLSPSFAVKTAGDPLAVSPAIREAIRSLDAELPVPAFSRHGPGDRRLGRRTSLPDESGTAVRRRIVVPGGIRCLWSDRIHGRAANQ